VCLRVGANTLIPDGLNDGSQGILRPRMRVKIRRKPWSVPRFRLRKAYGATGCEAVVSKAYGWGRAAFNCAFGCVKRQTSPIEP
jgi:hypothetical protein